MMPRPRLECRAIFALGLSLVVGGLTLEGTALGQTQPAPARDVTPRAKSPPAAAVAAEPKSAAKPAEKPAKRFSPTAVWLSVADSDGSGMKPLDILREYTFQGSPKWSPDGKRIAFNVWKDGESFNSGKIALVDADGGNPRILGDGLMPSFSPRGDRIVYSRPGTSYGVWVMSTEGPGKYLQRIDENGWGADWSPDGRLVYSTAAGKFKVVRKGSVVHYLFAEYGTDDYEQLDEKVINAEEIHFLKFAAVASDRQAGSEVVLEKLEIRAEELPDLVK
jgi:Tol biopolymer transport system component